MTNKKGTWRNKK